MSRNSTASNLPEKRLVRPREPVAVSPSFVSQLTSLSLLGVDPRRFLDFVVPACRPGVVHVGKLRLVELQRAVEALRALAVGSPTERPSCLPRQAETLDELLAEFGQELVSD